MSNAHETTNTPHKVVRGLLELENGNFVPVHAIKTAEQANSALAVVRMGLKETLRGLSPLFTKEVLLAVCMEIINEDDDADGPQTKCYSDHTDEQMEAVARSARS